MSVAVSAPNKSPSICLNTVLRVPSYSFVISL